MTEDISKVQRWLDLIAYLVGRHFPVPVEELMERLPAYARQWRGGDEKVRASVRRKFERDKDELRELGIPLETVTYSINYGMEEAQGYRIRKKDLFLPYLKLIGKAGLQGKRRGSPVRPVHTRNSRYKRSPGDNLTSLVIFFSRCGSLIWQRIISRKR